MLKALLQGKPLGHPLHPALVHLPIGLFVLSLLLDLMSFIGGGASFVAGASVALLLGVVAALVAAVPGLVDWAEIRRDHPGRRTATTHMALNLAAVALFAVDLLLRRDRLEAATTPVLPFVLSLAGVGLIAVAGYLGGTLIYDDGIGVGRHRRATPLPKRTVSVSARRGSDGFVVVADQDELGEGQTLRVEVDGTVMTVARVNGEYVAFQEFCPHRFGPLSAGCLADGEIECPWHRSRFDVRTGEVTRGPAKVDLKTYPVAIRDGKILVTAVEAKPVGDGWKGEGVPTETEVGPRERTRVGSPA